MADADVKVPEGGGGGLKGTLMKKVGPIPLVAWIVIAAAIIYYTRKKSTGSGGDQTDAAGNTGTINPKTGYVYGSAEDVAAGGGSGSLGGSLGSSSDSGTGGSTVAGQYADNDAWAVAAINYLVSIGVDATSANAAITQFLGSQQLTPAQQADVNLVIQRLGAPPSAPTPGGSPPPIVNPPSASTYATNPPTGFTTTSVGTTSIGVKWNAAVNAVSYTVSWGTSANATSGNTTVTTPAATVTGLKPNTLYYVRVQANPVKAGAAFASLSKTTAKAAGGTTPTKPAPKPSDKTPTAHKVTKDGESYSSIAKQYGYKAGGTALWKYNIGASSPHSAEAKAKLKKQGANLLLHGQTVYVPKA
jgi:Fibronectin type III domain